jgi:hypothetical protein
MGDDLAEAAQLRGGAAEGELGSRGGDEVAVQRVGRVDAHPAVHVDGGVRDPVARVGGPELGAGDRRVGLGVPGPAGREQPGGLPHREPDRLDVDVGVGQTLRHRLERPDRPPELLAAARVLGRQLERPLEHPGLHRAHAHGAPRHEPVRHLGAAGHAAEYPVVIQRDAVEHQPAGVRVVRQRLRLHRHPAVGGFDQEHQHPVRPRGRNQRQVGPRRRRHDRLHAGQPPALARPLGPRRRGPRIITVLLGQGDGEQHRAGPRGGRPPALL